MMKEKKRYIAPLITNIVIDRTISMALESEPGDPWGSPQGAPPPPNPSWGSKGGDNSGPSNDTGTKQNSFTDNPFR